MGYEIVDLLDVAINQHTHTYEGLNVPTHTHILCTYVRILLSSDLVEVFLGIWKSLEM